MTVVASWIRKINRKKDIYEIVMISDSRLNNGIYWDECPKLMKFERDDCILGFAGDTAYSYPLMLQTNNAINEYSKVQRGAMSFDDLAGHTVRLMNDMTSRAKNYLQPLSNENAMIPYINEYIFAGYDWLRKKFLIKTISCVVNNYKHVLQEDERKQDALLLKYDDCSQEVSYGITNIHYELKNSKKYSYKKVVQDGQINFENFEEHFGQIAVIGDKREDFVSKLKKILKRKYGENYEASFDDKFDMEPYEALCELLEDEKDDKYSTIGGAPQMLKVYQYMNSGVIGVYWPERDKNNIFNNRTLLGRKLLGYENTDYWFWDSKAQRTFPCMDGMNRYVDMFQYITIKYVQQPTGRVKVFVNINKDIVFMRNCVFQVKSHADNLTYDSSYKIKLQYTRNDEDKVFPISDLKWFVVPSREMFDYSPTYEAKGIQKDVFDIVQMDYSFKNPTTVCPRIKKRESYYSNFCEFEIVGPKDTYEATETFEIQLFYDKAGAGKNDVEPYQYVKRYHVPTKRELQKCYTKKLLITSLLKVLNMSLE